MGKLGSQGNQTQGLCVIIARLNGGLGNQLFQYACGRALADHWNVPLKLDTSAYFAGGARSYALGPYALKAEVLNASAVHRLMEPRCLGRWMDRLAGRIRPCCYQEPSFHFDHTLVDLEPPLLLDGYWQSERYFRPLRFQLQSELSLSLEGPNATMAAAIATTNSVAVHVRRGDYLSNPAASVCHGTCPPDYYRHAAEIIEHSAGPVHYYLFGDDPAWARKALDFLSPATIVDINAPQGAHFDLELMRRCRHHIIANSTLSWWGAWLADAGDKIVITPKRWFLDSAKDTRDLIPSSWHRI